jgi:hypothetical protein
MSGARTELAESGAAALLGVAGTPAWAEVSHEYAQVLGRGDNRLLRLITLRLEELAMRIDEASETERESLRRELQTSWATRLSDVLQEQPEIAQELEDLTTRTLARLPADQHVWVQNIRAAKGGSAYGVQHGNQYINHGPGVVRECPV